MQTSLPERDVFISYASEDLETVARPLANILSAFGLKVWFDQFDLRIGDSLLLKITDGLKKCRYGIVILSKAFFEKHYPELELTGLAQKETDGQKVILPVWFNVNANEVRSYSPILADRVAARWEEGIETVATKLVQAIKPEIIENLARNLIILPRLKSGKEIFDTFPATCPCGFWFPTDEITNQGEIDIAGDFQQCLRDYGNCWDDIEIPGQMKAALEMTDKLREMEQKGWYVYGTRILKDEYWAEVVIATIKQQETSIAAYIDRKQGTLQLLGGIRQGAVG